MPTYEYVCSSCDNHLEVVQSFSDEALSECDRCGGILRRVFHPVGVLFKGSGFYSTDARSKKKDAGKPAERSKSEKPGEAKADASEKSA